ncbi:hypothetical protein LX81_03602 [Palleronia aestuarii]|uniref:Uncharacterized protein n=2 Tax=Palleronia aestuarii TaxID=568105 RepID=A0A2W7MX08_9RHOB|nr:hypothetical protein LX81_03602 [Palleronia aestuarii]
MADGLGRTAGVAPLLGRAMEMRWFGMPVAAVVGMVGGRFVEIASVYEWSDGTRRIVWLDREAARSVRSAAR